MPHNSDGPGTNEHHTHLTGVVARTDLKAAPDDDPVDVVVSEHIAGEKDRAWCVTRCSAHYAWMLQEDSDVGTCPDPCPDCTYVLIDGNHNPLTDSPAEEDHEHAPA